MKRSDRELWQGQTVILAAARAGAGKPCQFCKGMETVLVEDGPEGKRIVGCVCVLVREEVAAAVLYQDASHVGPADRQRSFGQFASYGAKDQWRTMQQAGKAIQSLVNSPHKHKWVLVSGSPGCGKSHLLLSAYNQLRQYAIYANVTELSVRLRQGLDRSDRPKPDGWMETSELEDLLAQVPVLFLDDLGAENPNSEFIQSTLTDIVARRYQMELERPTVISTNLAFEQLYKRYPRLGSRALDKELVEAVKITLPDHRSWVPAAEKKVK